MKKKKINFKKLIIIILIIMVVGLSIFLIKSCMMSKEEKVKDPKIISKINDYELRESASTYFKNVFNDLKKELNKDEIDEENYAKIISKLFISDCYTLDNKINQSDVGGIQFVYEPFRNDFLMIAKDTMYHHIENNIYDNRKQKLPVVSNVVITSIEQDKFEYLDKVDENAYYVDVEIEYVKDLGYAKKASLVLIHNNDKLEVAKLN